MAGDRQSEAEGGRGMALAVGCLGAAAVITQLALMREMLGMFTGNEMVLGIILGNWLLLTGLGSWLGRTANRLQRPLLWLVLLLVLVALLPLAQVFTLRALRNVVFLRGATAGVTETVVATLLWLAPFCVVSGYMLTLACRATSAIGRVYVADSVGSIIGGAAFAFVLVQRLDHFALLCMPGFVCLLVAGWLAWRDRHRWLARIASVLAASVLVLPALDVDAVSTALQFPGQRVVFRGNSPYGKLVVTEAAGQFNFIENGVPVVSTRNVEQVEETTHYAMAQRPQARRVLLIGGGVAGTAREILKHEDAEVKYVELDPLIIEAGKRFLPESLTNVRVINTDGRLFVKQTTEKFDVVIVDVPAPATSQLNRYYTVEFFGEVKRVLAPDGVVSFALGRYENYVSPKLARLLASGRATVRREFRNVLVLPGGRVFFLASDAELTTDIAARLEHVPTQWVNRHYLDATLTPDRLADMRRATAQPAPVNEDFNPVLYYLHLLNWMSQFKVRFGVLEAALLVALAAYVVTLRAVPLAIFVSGFAASALEIVLLLGFQILYGSVYRQVGVIVTVFMAGLAAGAWVVNRQPAAGSRKHLAGLAFAIAGAACLVPAVVRVERLGPWTIALATLLVAALVGMEFPVAARVEPAGAGTTAARLYTADFVGASLGALLASTLLIPLLGVTGVCLLTAGLNALGGALVLRRKG